MRALDRKLVRDLWHIKGQALAIALVVGCGVAVYVMSLGTLGSLEETRTAYYERYRFGEVFARLKRAPEGLSERIAAIPGVRAAETRIVQEVTLDIAGMDEPAMARLVSLPEGHRPALNDISLVRGRYLSPGRPNEVLIAESLADAHGLGPGDSLRATINGHRRRLDIVGVALSPEYVYTIGPGVLVPDDRRFGIIWMGRKSLAAAFDLDGAFNDVSLSLMRGASVQQVVDDVDRLLAAFGGVGAYGRADQLSHSFLDSELQQLRSIGAIIPPIFLGVAAFLLNIVFARLIRTEREQIGLLKATGYSHWTVGAHYMKFALAIVLVGVVFGLGTGMWLGRAVTRLYAEFYRFPVLTYLDNAQVLATAALIAIVAAILAIAGAVGRAVRLPPAAAMQPAPPPMFRRLGWPFARRASALITQPTRMVLRHIVRWPLRAALTTFGISLAVAILVASLSTFDAVDRMMVVFFDYAQRQDATVTFVDPQPRRILWEVERLPGVRAGEPFRGVAARLRLGPRTERVVISGIERGATLRRILDAGLDPVAPPESGLILSSKLAELLEAGRGDRLTVEILEGRRPVREVTVAAVVDELIGIPAYMELEELNRLLREGPMISGVYLLIDGQRAQALYRHLKDAPAVAGVSLQKVARQTFEATMAETLYVMTGFYVLFGSLIAIGVVYNSARIGLSERSRELASLRVLGFTRFEVSYILLGELGILTTVALPLGAALGRGLTWVILDKMDSKLFRVPLTIDAQTYGIAMAIVLVAAVASGLLVRRRLDALDLVEVLKSRE